METLFPIVTSGILYLLVGVFLFVINILLFEWWTPFDVRNGIIKTQNKALGLLIRGQIIAQGISISAVIFFTGYTPDHASLQPIVFLPSILYTIGLGIIGMITLQGILWGIMKIVSIEKEIIVDQNEALGSIIEAFLIAFSILISVAFYSY